MSDIKEVLDEITDVLESRLPDEPDKIMRLLMILTTGALMAMESEECSMDFSGYTSSFSVKPQPTEAE